MQYPSIKLVVPSQLKNVENGKLDKKILAKTDNGGEMWSWAAVAFNLMHAEAKKAGIKLQNIGDYRPYSEQLAMFNDRYMDKETGRVPTVTRKWQGKTWYLKKGKSPSGVPGTSNHGLGLAMDINVQDGKVGKWLCENAPKYGFYLQGSDPKSPEFELWHWQYCVGDKVPQPVQELMAALAAMKK